MLQRSCDRLFQWSNQWLLKLNVDKCKVLSIGIRNTTDFTYYLGDVNDRIELERTSSMKDLGVIIDCRLKFQGHIKLKINKAYSMLGILRRNLTTLDFEQLVVHHASSTCTNIIMTTIRSVIKIWWCITRTRPTPHCWDQELPVFRTGTQRPKTKNNKATSTTMGWTTANFQPFFLSLSPTVINITLAGIERFTCLMTTTRTCCTLWSTRWDYVSLPCWVQSIWQSVITVAMIL